MTENPTHCAKGHPAMWCTCKRFVAAPTGTFTDMPTIQYPPLPSSSGGEPAPSLTPSEPDPT